MFALMFLHVYVDMYTHMCTCTNQYMVMHMRTIKHTHTHTLTHTHTHTPRIWPYCEHLEFEPKRKRALKLWCLLVLAILVSSPAANK